MYLVGLPLLRAGVVEILSAECRWELGESVTWVHFDTVVFTAALVRWLECAVVCWAMECYQLIKTVTHAFECAACAVKNPEGVGRFAVILITFADYLLRNFHEAVNYVAEGAT